MDSGHCCKLAGRAQHATATNPQPQSPRLAPGQDCVPCFDTIGCLWHATCCTFCRDWRSLPLLSHPWCLMSAVALSRDDISSQRPCMLSESVSSCGVGIVWHAIPELSSSLCRHRRLFCMQLHQHNEQGHPDSSQHPRLQADGFFCPSHAACCMLRRGTCRKHHESQNSSVCARLRRF